MVFQLEVEFVDRMAMMVVSGVVLIVDVPDDDDRFDGVAAAGWRLAG